MGDKATDPQVEEIARVLLAEGRYVTRLETGNLQALVDAGWAARQAGQLLGRLVRVETSRPDEPAGGLVVVAELVDA
jgi:hypothetical protein